MDRIRLALFATAFALTACATTDTVYLQNMAGETAKCGPNYFHLGFFNEKGQETDVELRALCVADWERRGFRRVAAPAR